MDYGLSSRRAVVQNEEDPIGLACVRALRAEGVAVVDAAELVTGGAVDIVVAHGPSSSGSRLFDGASVDELDSAWTSVVDAVDLYRNALPGMAERRWGRFVWIGTANSKSLGANRDDDELDLVVTLAMRAVGKVVASEAGPVAITANAVLHGGDATPDDVAAAAVFLCSEGAGYITGVTMTVDGGAGSAVF